MSLLGTDREQLSSLYDTLKGDPNPRAPQELTPAARRVLQEVQRAVSARQVHRIDPSIDVIIFVTNPDFHPMGIIGQWSDKWSDPLHVLEWLFLPSLLAEEDNTLIVRANCSFDNQMLSAVFAIDGC